MQTIVIKMNDVKNNFTKLDAHSNADGSIVAGIIARCSFLIVLMTMKWSQKSNFLLSGNNIGGFARLFSEQFFPKQRGRPALRLCKENFDIMMIV